MKSLLEKILGFENKRVDPTIINSDQVGKLVESLLSAVSEEIPGDVVEFGCYVGESSKYLMKTILETNSKKKLYVYDSFEGLPDLSEWEKNTGWRAGTLKTSRDVLEQNFIENGLPAPFIHKNWFKNVPEQSLPEKISFAFLDGDFYDSIYDSLEKIFDRVEDNGYILFHDYERNDLPGVKAAVDTFLSERGLSNDSVVLTDQLALYRKPVGVPKMVKKPFVATDNLTLVTGLWNIGRQGRDFSHYIENFKKFLDIETNMFIHIPKEFEYLVWQNPKRTKQNTHVRIFELEDLKRNLYSPFWDRTQEIRTNSSWLNQTGWLQSSPQAVNEWYNPIVQSKMFMLHDAKILNVFDTDYFLWLDAGISNTVYEKYFTDNRCLDKIIPHLSSFLFLSYPYEADSEIHGFNFKEMNKLSRQKVTYVCRGGLFGGHKDYISVANSTYYHLLDQTLSQGLMGTEESIFSIMAHLEPHIYKRYALDENGLVVKFVQALLDDKVELENSSLRAYNAPKGIYNAVTDKTSIYVLSFNFPDQFRTLIESFEMHPEWLKNTRKILINNSDNEAAIAEYSKICEQYGFEHIITGENLGINRGRLYAAKHFQESDSHYYFFFEDDMCLHRPTNIGICRNGFRHFVPGLFTKAHNIMAREELDFLKLSFTEVYMDNNIQVSWYNVPQAVRTDLWPEYDQLPASGLDIFAPRTKFDKIEVYDGLSYITGDIYYANWPMLVSKKGNQKMFLDVQWQNPFEQTWMSYMFQETIKGNIKPAILLASPINHNRIFHYKKEDRREN